MSERDELYAKFEQSIYDVQQKTGLKGLILERKLEALSEELEKKEAQLAEVLAASNLDAGTLQQVNQKLEEVLENKNQIIRALQYDVAKARGWLSCGAAFATRRERQLPPCCRRFARRTMTSSGCTRPRWASTASRPRSWASGHS